jgi:hypothetical protein
MAANGSMMPVSGFPMEMTIFAGLSRTASRNLVVCSKAVETETECPGFLNPFEHGQWTLVGVMVIVLMKWASVVADSFFVRY